jgi:serine/threonine protein kinase
MLLAIESTSALEEAHMRDVSHRDLKPVNMPMTATGAANNWGTT